MKKRTIIILAILSIICVVSCQKSRYCRCISTETTPNDTLILNLDRSMKCDRIMTMGKEIYVEGQSQVVTYTYSCTKIDKDTVPTIPNLPTEE